MDELPASRFSDDVRAIRSDSRPASTKTSFRRRLNGHSIPFRGAPGRSGMNCAETSCAAFAMSHW